MGSFTIAVAAASVYIYYDNLAEEEDIAEVGKMPERSLVFDRNSELIGRMHGANRETVPLGRVSPYFLDALLAREDARFYRHAGIDFRGVARAALRNLRDRRFVQGASTITMQLARVSFDIREKTLHRKMLEAFLARRIEEVYSKEEILTSYINRIYFGTGFYGIERASQAYFGKAANDLNLSESAMLAGIIRAPNRFSPFRNFQGALRERDMVLERMRLLGFVTAGEVADAQNFTPLIRPAEETYVRQNSYALDLVRRDLDQILEDEEMEDGGLLIYTTLDAGLQQAAEIAMEDRLRAVEARPDFAHPTRANYLARVRWGEEVEPEYLQGAIVAIDNENGGILALVGGRNFDESQYNRATMSSRQIGSLFKPFVYTAAYQNGLLPGTLVDDWHLRPGEISWWPGEWSPRNSDDEYLQPQAAETGLIRSRNTMSVRVGEQAGIDRVLELARQAGFDPPSERSPQIYIGNLGADLKSLTSAYSAFPNEGYQRLPYVIDFIQNRRGEVIYNGSGLGRQMLPQGAAWLTHQGMRKVLESGGTGRAARDLGLDGPAAGKTGTTNDYRDAWFAGYTDRVTCGVWVGFDQPKTIISKGYGSTLALPIWTDVMKSAAERGFPAAEPVSRISLANVELCEVSGGLANWSCQQGGHAYTAAIPYELVPSAGCGTHRGLLGGGPPSGESPDSRGFIRRIRNFFSGD